MDIKPIRQKTVVAQVMEQIRNLIASGDYKPGDRFPTEFELAEMFGIGRSSIREAMKIFQHIGVLESKVPKGTFVADSSNISKESLTWSILLGNNDFYDLLEFRLVMEHQGLWYIMVYHAGEAEFKDSIVAQLETEVQTMREAIQREDYTTRLEADYRFHKHIIGACDNDIFNAVYENLHAFLIEEIKRAQKDRSYIMKTPEHHQKLIDSIKSNDFDEASNEFRSHIRDVNKVFNHPHEND